MNLNIIVYMIFATCILVEAKLNHRQIRETVSLCDPMNMDNKVQCYCNNDHKDPDIIRSAECYLAVAGILQDDSTWNNFNELKNISKLIILNTRGIPLRYIPTNGLKNINSLIKLDIKYADIETVEPFAFANSSTLEEITIRGNQIKTLSVQAFANHKTLKTISLDDNRITEINREVFVNLPSLESLFLTDNKITTIHDKAFIYLTELKELEIDRNKLFSLNSETFSGLSKLQKLFLSGNSLEVIGDNTFKPLISLQYLNLDSNHIQMLDGRAFNGLTNLQSLSLARNNLTSIENVNIFDGLRRLTLLSLKGNSIRVLKAEAMAPILNNFYGKSSILDVEDNNLPCGCHLDWFVSLMNKTTSSRLKIALENLKCSPDTRLKEMWDELVEAEKNEEKPSEGKDAQGQEVDYEYYDESQLNGKLFYNDIRPLLNCTDSVPYLPISTQNMPPEMTTYKIGNPSQLDVTKRTEATNTKETVTVPTNKNMKSTIPVSVTEQKSIKVTNQGILNLSDDSAAVTDTTNFESFFKEQPKNDYERNKIKNDIKPNLYTTTRLATVSAKPNENSIYDDNIMASDEAKPDAIKSDRSVQDKTEELVTVNDSTRVKYVSTIFVAVLCFNVII